MPITNTIEISDENQRQKTKWKDWDEFTKEEKNAWKQQKKDKCADMKREFVEKIIGFAKEKQHFPWEEPNFLNFPKSLVRLESIEKFNKEYPENPKDRNEGIYRRGNLIKLSMITNEKGYTDSRWATFQHIKKLGGKIKKGEHGTTIWVYKPESRIRREKNPETGRLEVVYKKDKSGNFIRDKNGDRIPEKDSVLTTQTVFNVCQAEGLKLEPEPAFPALDAKGKCEKMEYIIAHSEASVKHDQYAGNGRYYSPLLDEVHVPPVELFKSMSAYYATVAHEIGHSTGHEKRCNRDLSGMFGSNSYAREEMVAELTAVFLSRELGVKIPPKEMDNHAEYIRNWDQNIKTLTEKPEELYAIINDAEKATEYIKTHMLKKELSQEKLEEPTVQKPENAKEIVDVAQKLPKKALALKKISSSKNRTKTAGISR